MRFFTKVDILRGGEGMKKPAVAGLIELLTNLSRTRLETALVPKNYPTVT